MRKKKDERERKAIYDSREREMNVTGRKNNEMERKKN